MPAVGPIVGAVVAASITSAVGATAAAIIGAIVSAAVSMGMSALMKSKPDKPAITARRDQLLVTARDAVRPREMVIGKVRKGGTVLFMDTVDNDTTILMWIEFAGMEVQAIDEIYFFDELGIDQAGNIQPKFQGFVQFEKFLGPGDQQASRLLMDATPKWTEDHRSQGIAGVALKLQRSGDIFSQHPNVTAVLRGAKMYDPRDGTTSYTNNAALALAHYLNHPIYGLSAPYGTVIDNTMLSTAANICDEDVAIKAGKTLEFNTDTDVVAVPNADLLNPPGSFTLEARIYPTDLSSVRPIVLKDDGVRGYGLYLQPNGILRFFVRGLGPSTIDSPIGTIAGNTWQHVSGRYNAEAGTISSFVNGVLVAQASVGGSISRTSSRMAIGGGFRGRLQDVRLWWEARSNSAINAFKDRTLSGTEANLAVYLKLDEKRGTFAEDACEIPNDGTITGAVWVDDDSVIGTEKRYQANGVIFSDQMPREIIEDLLSAMVGSAVPSGGKWLIRAGAFESPTVSFDENDARDSIFVQPWRPRNELFNSVRGTYLAPENDWQPADFPIITFPAFEAQDGPVGSPKRITQDIELPFTSSPSMAQRIAWLHLLRNREQVSCKFKTKLRGLRVRAGDFLYLTNQRFGWDGKPFEVITWEFVPIQDEQGNPALGVDMELREIAAAVYDFNPATDQVPINPSPNTRLPSPFGRIAMVSDFVDRNGFEEIVSPDQAGVWPGTMFGFVPNPLTGHLNAEDLMSASGDDQSVFDEYCRDPVPFPYYLSPEIDIEFEDTVRTYIDATFGRGPGEDGRIDISKYYDVKVLFDPPDFPAGFNPEAFNPEAFSAGMVTDPVLLYEGWRRIATHVKATGRYFIHKIEFDFRESAGYLATFTPIVDKMTLFQRGVGETIPVGGKTIFFNKRYHNLPSLNPGSLSGGARFVEFSEKTDVSFKATVFDADADDSGGTIDWTAAGV